MISSCLSEASCIICSFAAGIIISDRPIVAPKRVAYLNPISLTESNNCTATEFFLSAIVSPINTLSSLSPKHKFWNSIPSGNIELKITLPGVVLILLPFSNLNKILALYDKISLSIAASISPKLS